MPVNHDTLRHMHLNPEQVEKLLMQEPSPSKSKYQNPSTGILSPLVDSHYATLHKRKVNQFDQRVDQYVRSHEQNLPRDLVNNDRRTKMPSPINSNNVSQTNLESNRVIGLCDGDSMRKQGNSLLARQVELENMKVRQFKAKQQANDKNLELHQDAKMREMLSRIHQEHYEVEKWQKN